MKIDSINQISLKTITLHDLQVHFRTGQDQITRTDRAIQHQYRSGIQCDLGDVEIHVWADAVESLLQRMGRSEEIQNMYQHLEQNCPWFHNSRKLEQRILVLENLAKNS